MKETQDSSEEKKKAFIDSYKIIIKEIEKVDKEISGEVSVTDTYLDTHIKELEEKSKGLIARFKKLFTKE
jgi:hypothetical protein